MTSNVSATLRRHLSGFWPERGPLRAIRPGGPIRGSLKDFEIVVAAPSSPADGWVYASIGAWTVPTPEEARFEFVITSPVDDPIHVETLSMVAHFHADPRYGVYPGKILDIGRPWLESSRCTHLLVSLPYPFGPVFERCQVNATVVRLLWLMPITASEAEFGKARGIEALEDLLEREAVDTLDVSRPSVA